MFTGRKRDTNKQTKLVFWVFSFRLFETLLPMILLVKSEERHDRSDHSQVMLSCKTSEFKKSQRFLL